MRQLVMFWCMGTSRNRTVITWSNTMISIDYLVDPDRSLRTLNISCNFQFIVSTLTGHHFLLCYIFPSEHGEIYNRRQLTGEDYWRRYYLLRGLDYCAVIFVCEVCVSIRLMYGFAGHTLMEVQHRCGCEAVVHSDKLRLLETSAILNHSK